MGLGRSARGNRSLSIITFPLTWGIRLCDNRLRWWRQWRETNSSAIIQSDWFKTKTNKRKRLCVTLRLIPDCGSTYFYSLVFQRYFSICFFQQSDWCHVQRDVFFFSNYSTYSILFHVNISLHAVHFSSTLSTWDNKQKSSVVCKIDTEIARWQAYRGSVWTIQLDWAVDISRCRTGGMRDIVNVPSSGCWFSCSCSPIGLFTRDWLDWC